MSTSDYITIFGIMVGLFLPVLGGYIGVRIQLAKQSVHIENLKNDSEEFKDTADKIFKKLEEINNTLHKKADR